MKYDFDLNADRIEIPISKFKTLFLLIIGLAFVVGGVEFIMHPETFAKSTTRNTPVFFITLIGYVCAIFFGLCTAIAIFQLFNNNPGLIIDENGIVIPGLFSKTFVAWHDIEEFNIVRINRTKLIGIYLKDPEKCIEQQNNFFTKQAASFSYKTVGTPMSITTNNLKCNSDELYALLTERLNQSV